MAIDLYPPMLAVVNNTSESAEYIDDMSIAEFDAEMITDLDTKDIKAP